MIEPEKKPSAAQIRVARRRFENQLRGFPNVVGTALGNKISDGKITSDKAVIVYVDAKKNKISSSKKIPKHIVYSGMKIPTDVVEVSALRFQSQAPFYCSDGSRLGIVSSMCKTDRFFFAATCAHNLKGSDADIYSKDPMQLFDRENNKWINVGQTSSVYYSDGIGADGNYGFVDAGLFTIEDESLIKKLKAATTLPVNSKIFWGQQVYAIATGGHRLTGAVAHVESSIGNIFSDVCIKIDPPGSTEGDSGMLWRSTSGKAVAVHSKGFGDFDNNRTQFSLGMFAYRFKNILNVELLDL